ncbi:MAG: hypothetical protein ACJAVY_001448 [Marinoscillum sp.]|jgi:hypothetical protein
MTKQVIISILALFVSLEMMAQVPAPGAAQSQPIAIANATAHLGNGEVIENSLITFDLGKITFVGEKTSASMDLAGYKMIDAKGKHVYPGLILPLSKLGLVEVSAVRASRDYSEVGEFNPNVRTAVAYNTDSELIPTMKFNGIQIAQIAPTGGRIEGMSSIMQLDAWNWEDALYSEDDGIHINWPSLSSGARWWMGETERSENKEYKKEVDELMQFISDAKAYMNDANAERNLKLDAMVPVLKGERTIYMYANRPKEIVEGIQMLKEAGIEKLVLTGGREVWEVRDILKSYKVPVLLDNVHRIPGSSDDDIDWSYRLPGLLDADGVLVGLNYAVGSVASARNLPFFAGTVAAYDVDKEVALKMVTSNTAKILGIDQRTGTLEKGKDANIVISEGDLLDMRGNIISYSFIQGREVDLHAMQQRLYEKFKTKYSGK